MTDESRERDTLPEGLAPPSRPELDTGAAVIKQLFDENLTPFLERQAARDERFHELVERFMDQSLINHADMSEIKSDLAKIKERQDAADRRMADLESRLNG